MHSNMKAPSIMSRGRRVEDIHMRNTNSYLLFVSQDLCFISHPTWYTPKLRVEALMTTRAGHAVHAVLIAWHWLAIHLRLDIDWGMNICW